MQKIKKTKDNSEVKNLQDQLKRALADYHNLQKRTEEEKKQVVRFANTVLTVKFLDILDNLEAAQNNLQDQGLELIIKKFKDILASENISEIEASDATFDPSLHEAVSVVEGDKDNQVVEVLQKGYQLDDKVIRPARVKVSQASGGSSD